MERYRRRLRDGGLRQVQGRVIPNSGHFMAEEQPQALLAVLRALIGLST